MNSFKKLLDFLDRLENSGIYFTLCRCRPEAIMVRADVPGERWEVEFFADGSVEVEVFGACTDGNAGIHSENHLEDLFKRFADPAD